LRGPSGKEGEKEFQGKRDRGKFPSKLKWGGEYWGEGKRGGYWSLGKGS